MKTPYDIILKPVVTENTMEQMTERKYTFKVDKNSSKTEIKAAIETIFGVKVEKVNIMNYKGKFKRMGKFGGYTNKRRKAIVKLTQDSKEIEFFEV